MSDFRYFKFGTPEGRLVEECAELVLAIQKAERFGWFPLVDLDGKYHDNMAQVLTELADVQAAITVMRHEIKRKQAEQLARDTGFIK